MPQIIRVLKDYMGFAQCQPVGKSTSCANLYFECCWWVKTWPGPVTALTITGTPQNRAALIKHTLDCEMVHKVWLDIFGTAEQPNRRSKFLEWIGARSGKVKWNPFETCIRNPLRK